MLELRSSDALREAVERRCDSRRFVEPGGCDEAEWVDCRDFEEDDFVRLVCGRGWGDAAAAAVVMVGRVDSALCDVDGLRS